MRRIIATILALCALTVQANAAGSISLSLSQQFDAQGRPLSGGLLYFFVSGTTTPQNAFQDTGLTIPWPNPIVLDSSGRVPPFYLADGTIKIRLTDSSGVTIIAADGLLVIGPSAGGGGGGSIDATTVLATGDVKARYGVGTLSGFVRANGRTIGSATSGATERANADCQALFEYLWTADPNLTVSTGRGASANADWVANKTIALPDMRGRLIAGMDDMGATAASRLTSTGLGTSATVLGAAGGAQTRTLIQGNLPSVNLSASGGNVSLSVGTAVTVTDSHTHNLNSHVHTYNVPDTSFSAAAGSGANVWTAALNGVQNTGTPSPTTTTQASPAITAALNSGAVTGTVTTPLGGSGTALATITPSMVMTFYMKL